MKVEKTQLKNKSTLIGIRRPGSGSVAIQFGFKVGSRAENKDNAGISHFLEHMVFKGSKKRPTAKEISRAFDRIGAQVNAATSKEWTFYHIKTTPENFDVALDIIGDMITTPILSEKELEKEKGTVIQELKMVNDDPAKDIGIRLEEVAFGPKTGLGRSIIGYEKSIKTINSKIMRAFYNKYYVGENCCCVVSGELPADYKKRISLYLNRFKMGKQNIYQTGDFSTQRVSVNEKVTDQTYLGLGVPGLSINNDNRYTLEVATTVLAGFPMMSNRLFTEIREKRGWSYRLWGYSDNSLDTGLVEIEGGIKTNKILDAIKVIINEMLKLGSTITQEEVDRAKGFIMGSVPLRFDDNDQLASFVLINFLISDRIILPDDEMEKIAKVTRADIKKLVAEMFTRDRIYLAIIGPFKDSKKFDKILAESNQKER